MSRKGSNTTAYHLSYNDAMSFYRHIMSTGDERIGLLVLVMIHTGLRIGDAVKLKHSDLSGARLLVVEKKTGKTRNIPLPTPFLSEYKNFNQNSTYICQTYTGGTIDKSRANLMIKEYWTTFRYNNKVDYPDDFGFCSHALRKTYAWNLFSSPVSNDHIGKPMSLARLNVVSSILKHSNIGITTKYLNISSTNENNLILNSF